MSSDTIIAVRFGHDVIHGIVAAHVVSNRKAINLLSRFIIIQFPCNLIRICAWACFDLYNTSFQFVIFTLCHCRNAIDPFNLRCRQYSRLQVWWSPLLPRAVTPFFYDYYLISSYAVSFPLTTQIKYRIRNNSTCRIQFD